MNLPPTLGDGAANHPHGWAEIIFFNLFSIFKFSEKVNYPEKHNCALADAGRGRSLVAVYRRPAGRPRLCAIGTWLSTDPSPIKEISGQQLDVFIRHLHHIADVPPPRVGILGILVIYGVKVKNVFYFHAVDYQDPEDSDPWWWDVSYVMKVADEYVKLLAGYLFYR